MVVVMVVVCSVFFVPGHYSGTCLETRPVCVSVCLSFSNRMEPSCEAQDKAQSDDGLWQCECGGEETGEGNRMASIGHGANGRCQRLIGRQLVCPRAQMIHETTRLSH